MIDYKEKIKKLLALAESDNEHEAQAAMVKAQKLMVEHKISISEVQDVGKREAVEKPTDVTYSPRKDPWILPLANVIAKNYCCSILIHHDRIKPQTRHLNFIGLEEDLDVCLIVFNYALDCIRSGVNYRKQKLKVCKVSQKEITSVCNGYAYGFISGVKTAFEKQKKECESSNSNWGLVVSTPPEVIAKLNSIGTKPKIFNSKQSESLSKVDYIAGKQDGKDFDITKRVAANS